MCVEDEKEDIIKRSESVRERNKKRKRESFSRERRARRRTRKRIISTSSFQKFKRETKVPKTKTSSSSQQTRANKERERKNTYNRIPGDGVKFHKLLASPTFGPCSAIDRERVLYALLVCVKKTSKTRERRNEGFEGGI
jgi:hypothetical protein